MLAKEHVQESSAIRLTPACVWLERELRSLFASPAAEIQPAGRREGGREGGREGEGREGGREGGEEGGQGGRREGREGGRGRAGREGREGRREGKGREGGAGKESWTSVLIGSSGFIPAWISLSHTIIV